MNEVQNEPLRDRYSLHTPPAFWQALCRIRNMLMPIRASMYLIRPLDLYPDSFLVAFDIVDRYLERAEADGWLEFEESEEQES